MERRKHVGVIGAGECPNAVYTSARSLGFEIGKKGWILVCGGLGGVMEGAAEAARRLEGRVWEFCLVWKRPRPTPT